MLFDDAILDGCDASPVGDVVTGKTTTSKSTIVGEVTGLEPDIDYQCYVIVQTDKRSKCKSVVTPTIEGPIDVPVVRMVAVNSNTPPVAAFFLPNITEVPPGWEAITSSTSFAPYTPAGWASLAGDVMAVSIRNGDPGEGGLWYTDNITAFVEGTDAFEDGFTQLPLESESLSQFLGNTDSVVGFQIGFGDRMVFWTGGEGGESGGGIFVSDNWRENTANGAWTDAGCTYASLTGDLVAAIFDGGSYTPDNIILLPDAFGDGGTVDPADGIALDISGLNPEPGCLACAFLATSVSLYGDYLAFTSYFEADDPVDNVSKIYYIDLSTLEAPYDDATFVEVPMPTSWDDAIPLEVSIARGQMVVTFVTSVDPNNVAATADFINVGPDDWILLPGQVTHQQLSIVDDNPVPPVFVV